jgi:diamine N-acetyltransferase
MTSEPVDPTRVTLREITEDTVVSVIKLSVAEHQKGFVATNAVSLAQALFSKEAWYRAIYLDDEPAGFVMLYDESLREPRLETPEAPEAPEASEPPEIGVWRFMVDERFQGRGVGRAAMRLVIDHVRAKGLFATLELSYVPGEGNPEPFYRSLGFRHTGRMDDGEVVLVLDLEGSA